MVFELSGAQARPARGAFIDGLGFDDGKSALPFLECVDLPLQLSGVDQAPQDVVVEIPEAQGDPAQVLEPA
ncbi:hypothetical protein I4J22_07605, partial [Corynebacterium diphtheriae]|nr:hypothetical protein [Corynebacterium diphtheriae bv. gravis]MBG9250878.1 hypothetical protein [Corynebacterium diphtheriae bv. mitis]MBG9279415.1 hypothetical protein [Corynebacterium diphtheriae]MBG9255047.1 hypothetical protein [Corynebacterium diphtheriae bv. mitis]MBG9261808.1 hypothetical protein [Corynebacterium diphtheriae bv. mitis]